MKSATYPAHSQRSSKAAFPVDQGQRLAPPWPRYGVSETASGYGKPTDEDAGEGAGEDANDGPENGLDEQSETLWIDVLVDCPGAQGLYTYAVPPQASIKAGDILSVSFGRQQVGAIAIQRRDTPPPDLDPATVKPIDDVVSRGFFPPHYWTLLQQVAEYYCTPLIQVIRGALPPGLLGRSQRRIRLQADALPTGAADFLQPAARQLLECLQQQPQGDYTWTYLQRQVRGAAQGLRDLLQRGWVESYLESPTPIRPKQRQAVMLTDAGDAGSLSPRQQEILELLRRQGGDLWLQDLLQLGRTSSSVVHALARKGYVVVQPREVLRREQDSAPPRDRPKSLTPAQTDAVSQITALSGPVQVLLHGVTGSGKTEVYLQAIAPILARNQSALVLVPEIGLTPQLTDRFRARFGDRVQVYHSSLADGERYDTWRQMLRGLPQVVIGTRSAVFSPLPHLGLIILDEEHDSSFKQDQPAPCYHARTVARWRSQLEGCPLVLGTATPSLETWVDAQVSSEVSSELGSEVSLEASSEESISPGSVRALRVGALHLEPSSLDQSSDQSSGGALSPVPAASTTAAPSPPSLYLSLPDRIHDRPLPPIEIVDMRAEFRAGNRSIFSHRLQTALMQLRETGQQGILFIHRRGHSTFVSCRSCGEVMACPHCDVSLTYHQTHAEATAYLRCHYCGYGRSYPPQCPTCGSPYLKHFGSGTQRVMQELSRHLPDLRCLRFDRDTTRTKGAHRALLTRFAQGEVDVLVGTQMLAKGLDIPQVTLVGVVAADGLLNLADFRAGERAYQLLTQVAGRAGRGDEPGRVILQTYAPQHPVIEAVQHQHYGAFVKTELSERAALGYPPYGRLILLRLSSPDAEAVQQAAEQVAAQLRPGYSDTARYTVLGPAPAAIMRVARRYRWQILIKVAPEVTLDDAQLPDLQRLRSHIPSRVSLTIDVDPFNLL